MDVIVDRAMLSPGPGAPSFTNPLNKSGTALALSLVVQLEEEVDELEIRLQHLSGSSWVDVGDNIAVAGSYSSGLHVYSVPNPGHEDIRFRVGTAAPSSIDLSLISAENETTGKSGVVYPIDALGADVARGLPALRRGLEQLVSTALQPAPARAEADPQVRPSTSGAAEPTRLPQAIITFLLGAEIGHDEVNPEDFDQLAREAGMPSDELRGQINNVNMLTRTVRLLANRSGEASTEAFQLCGFWHAHLDPGPCNVGDVFVCNVADVHY